MCISPITSLDQLITKFESVAIVPIRPLSDEMSDLLVSVHHRGAHVPFRYAVAKWKNPQRNSGDILAGRCAM